MSRVNYTQEQYDALKSKQLDQKISDFMHSQIPEVEPDYDNNSSYIKPPKTNKPIKTVKQLAEAIKDNVKPNKKIKGAVKSVVNGIAFDSNLEKYMHGLLQGAGIDFEFQKVFILQNKFRYRIENIRAIKKIVDFYLPVHNVIIDTKGFSNDISPMKHKMLKSVLKYLYDMQPEIFMPKNKAECDLLLNKLLYDKDYQK